MKKRILLFLILFLLLPKVSFAVFEIDGKLLDSSSEKESVPGEIVVLYRSEQSPKELQEIDSNAYIYSESKQIELIDALNNKSDIQKSSQDEKNVLGISTKNLAQNTKLDIKNNRNLLPKKIYTNPTAVLKNLAGSKSRFLQSYFDENKIKTNQINTLKSFDQNLYVYKTTKDLGAQIKELQSFVEVESVGPNYLFHLMGTPNDPSFKSQWNMTKIDAISAWDIFQGSKATKVAVIDDGFDASHTDLSANFAKIIDACSSPGGSSGHGSHVAGIVGAIGNNSTGVSGINWEASIVGINVSCSSGITSNALIKAVESAISENVKVINMSLGGPDSPGQAPFKSVIKKAVDAGILVVVAAGNCGPGPSSSGCGNPSREISSDLLYPANDPNVLTIAASDETDNRAQFSSKGKSVDLSAPGTRILSTMPGGRYGQMSGTSQASPLVAGLATLIFAKNPSLDALTVRKILEDSADDLGASGRDDIFGEGRINAKKALSDSRVTSGGGGVPTSGISPTIVSTLAPSTAPKATSGAIPSQIPSVITPKIEVTSSQPSNIPRPTLVLPTIQITPGVPITITLPSYPEAIAQVVEQVYNFSCDIDKFEKLEYKCNDGRLGNISNGSCQKVQDLQRQAIDACASIQSDPIISAPTVAPSFSNFAHIELLPNILNNKIIDVFIDSGNQNISGADIVLNYDPMLVKILKIDPSVTTNFLNNAKINNDIPGQIYIAAISTDPNERINGRGAIGKIYLESISNGAFINIECEEGKTAGDSNISANTQQVTDIIECTKNINWENGAQNKGSTNITFRTRLQGVSSPRLQEITTKVGVKGGEMEDPIFKSIAMKHITNGVFEGTVNFNTVPGDDYTFYIKGPVHMQRKFCENNPKEIQKGVYSCEKGNLTLKDGENTFDFTNVPILVGDLPDSTGVQDGILNARDISQLRQSIDLGNNEISLDFCDVNFDGACNTIDWSLLISALSARGDEK